MYYQPENIVCVCVVLGDGGVSVEHFRRQRMELTAEKEAYNKCSSETMLEVR